MTKTQIVILWGLAVLVVLVLVVLGQALSRSSSAEEPMATPAVQSYALADDAGSARGLFPLADQAARSWQEDAGFVSVSSTWNALDVDALSVAGGWTYQFYSPGTRELFVANVSESQVTPIRQAPAPYPLAVTLVDDWRVDSPQALSAWLNHGGAEFLQLHPVVDLSVRLRSSEEGRLVWILAGVVPKSQVVHVVRVDAKSGGILE